MILIEKPHRIKSAIVTYLFIFLYAFSNLYSQEFQISGQIFDESGSKVSDAKVNLYSSDKRLIQSVGARSNGKFKIKKVINGKYTINIYAPGGFSTTSEIEINSSNKDELEITGAKNDLQPQIDIKQEVGKISITWKALKGASEYIIYKDNKEVSKTSNPFFNEELDPGKSYSYNIVCIDKNGEKGLRSLTEYGKALLNYPSNIVTVPMKNTINLKWDLMINASSYNIYRDDDLINTTSDNDYTDFKLKYDNDYSYSIVALDHHKEEGAKPVSISARTHKEVKKIKKIKAEAGESIVDLNWSKHELAELYKIYQNGSLVDSTSSLKYTAKTEPGSENCFTVTAINKYGTEGPQSIPACDKAQFPPPLTIDLTIGERYSDDMNAITINWDLVEGASSYNIYRDGKTVTNTKKTPYTDRDLEYGKEFVYEISSLSDDGLEGPLSEPFKRLTPSVHAIIGQLVNEKGGEKIEEAKVFLYTENNMLWEEYTAGANGKFKFENRIINGKYLIKAFGDGHGNNSEYAGNGGKAIEVKSKDINIKIPLSTKGLRPEMIAKRGVQKVLVKWAKLPHAESYSVYKNNKAIADKIKDNKFIDNVAPGKFYEYHVRAWDLYDLEGPESNKVKQKSSYQFPTLNFSIKSGDLKTVGSGRVVNLDWVSVPNVETYALYRDSIKISTQNELIYIDSLKWGTEYRFKINSLDQDNDEGAMSKDLIVNTHPEVLTPRLVVAGDVNSVKLSWDDLSPIATFYKVFRNGNYLGDFDKPKFSDNVAAGKEYCYSVSAADKYGTEGEQSGTHCGKGQFAFPPNFSNEIMKNTISFSWGSVEGASGYHLYRNNELIFTTSDFEYFDDSLKYDTEYEYSLASFDQDGDDGPKSILELRTHEEIISPVMRGAADLKQITVTWNQSPVRVDHIYKLYRDDILLSDLKDTFYVDIVDPGQYYCYRVSIKDKYGTEGPASNEECFKVLVNYPKDLSLNGDVKRVIFKWKKMLGAQQYKIYEHNKDNGETTLMTKTNSTYYIHKGLEFDTEYCYKLSSIDSDGDEGPLSPVMCGWVLPPPHLTLVEKYFVEQSDNQILDGQESGYVIIKVVNDGKSPARELKPYLNPVDYAITPSLVIDSVETISILDVGDSVTITFPIFAKLKIESGIRNFDIMIDEYAGTDLKPEPISFQTLAVIPPNLVISDFAVENEFGYNYIPKNETATLTVRFQNLSIGKTDTAILEFRRGDNFENDPDEVYNFGLIPGGAWFDYSFEILSKENEFTVYFDTYDYFDVRKTIPIHLNLLKYYKDKDDLVPFDMVGSDFIQPGNKEEVFHLLEDIPKGKLTRDAVGVVLSNNDFWIDKISGNPSSFEDAKIVRSYYAGLFGLNKYQMLPSQYWDYKDGITSSNFREIFNPDLGFLKDKIESNINYSKSDSIDLFLYYSGEGTTVAGSKCLIPYDADKNKIHSFFKINDLYKMLNEINKLDYVREIFLFMDVDFNNPSFSQNIIPEVVLPKVEKKKKKKKKKKDVEGSKPHIPSELIPPDGITAIFAANTTELSYNHPDYNNSIFTYYLLKGLKGEADNGDKAITTAELYNYIKNNVYKTTKSLYGQHPQTPQLFTENPERVILRIP